MKEKKELWNVDWEEIDRRLVGVKKVKYSGVSKGGGLKVKKMDKLLSVRVYKI